MKNKPTLVITNEYEFAKLKKSIKVFVKQSKADVISYLEQLIKNNDTLQVGLDKIPNDITYTDIVSVMANAIITESILNIRTDIKNAIKDRFTEEELSSFIKLFNENIN